MVDDMIVCGVCNCVDILRLTGPAIDGKWYCSEHHPNILKWHGSFEQESYNPDKHFVINLLGIGLHMD